jgi:hypothetical protein
MSCLPTRDSLHPQHLKGDAISGERFASDLFSAGVFLNAGKPKEAANEIGDPDSLLQ